ncbi:Histidine kinase [[Clostridium] ultunense Esp]|uniref:histidine kinase n=1 Tax=[Clostridium] ultunense Esp TaxID=1288971 RepID=M1ZJN8_9FIRM|nr:sensor histidine kinase [Schnuerera ultunensis]CCQ94362.1 Histidine kinase [[Clostridium] ultunense Esp]SHD78507.1 Histidine kinase [[Clostridium] ultunense Esp]
MANTFSKVERINEILQETIYSIESSKEEITEIVEYARDDVKHIEKELFEIKERVDKVIKEVNLLEIEERKSRAYLSNVSKNFRIYTEEDLKDAYDKANECRIRLLLKREEEKRLIERRKEQEFRLKSAIEVFEKAEKVRKSVSVVTEYLKGNLDEILFTVDHLNKRQVLGIKIIEAQEEERERLARDIHDGPAQSMANILVKAEICERLMDIDRNKSREELKNLKTIVRTTLKDLRKTIYDLRPMSLDDLGLIPTLERYIYNFIDYSGIDVKLNIMGDVVNLNSAIEVAVFRIIQESLNNVFKHSKATEARITLEYSPTRLNLSIVDNGIGFNQEEVNKIGGSATGGFGLISIKERVELLEGNIEIKSWPGRGTRINIYIMLPEEES